MLDFPPHVTNHQVPNPTSIGQPPKSPKLPFPGLDTLLGRWQAQGSSLKKKKEQSSRSSSIPLSATAPSKHQGLQQENEALITRQPLCCGMVISGPPEPNAFDAR